MAGFFKKYKYDLVILFIIILFIILAFYSDQKFGFFSSREDFQNYVMSFGPLAPIALILIIIVEVIVAPLPGFIPAISAGFVFGSVWGSVYAYIGNLIGGLIVFFLARKLGRPIIGKLFNQERVDKYSRAIGRHENYLLIFCFIPVVPTDIIVAAFGLSEIKIGKFVSVLAVGYIFYVAVMNIFGDYLASLYF